MLPFGASAARFRVGDWPRLAADDQDVIVLGLGRGHAILAHHDLDEYAPRRRRVSAIRLLATRPGSSLARCGRPPAAARRLLESLSCSAPQPSTPPAAAGTTRTCADRQLQPRWLSWPSRGPLAALVISAAVQSPGTTNPRRAAEARPSHRTPPPSARERHTGRTTLLASTDKLRRRLRLLLILPLHPARLSDGAPPCDRVASLPVTCTWPATLGCCTARRRGGHSVVQHRGEARRRRAAGRGCSRRARRERGAAGGASATRTRSAPARLQHVDE